MTDYDALPPLDSLTPREQEVLGLMEQGLSNREIAGELVISFQTAKWYSKQIYSKLDAHSRDEALDIAKEFGLLDDGPPSANGTHTMVPKHNLPIPVTSLVGRFTEIAEIRTLLNTSRLVTLTGPPGTGKTRLALHVALEMVDAYQYGVRYVELGPIEDPAFVAETITAAFALHGSGQDAVEDTLKDYLRHKDLLLVLDNFEQVVEAAPLIGELLAAAEGLKMLITSRQPLQVYGEHDYVVRPLSVPSMNSQLSLDDLTQSEAVALFAQRARAAKADFQVTDENASSIAEICLKLDGLPLAIELAAAQIKIFSPQSLLIRLEEDLSTLKTELRDLPERHMSLNSAIDWSYALLNETEQALLARLSVFVGGCSIEAAEAVCSDGLDIDMLDGLASLLNKGLLRLAEDHTGEPRFFMLETIHAYSRERLRGGAGAKDVRYRHATYFLELAERAEAAIRKPDEQRWMSRIELEFENIRATHTWLLSQNEFEKGIRLVNALHLFWKLRGYLAVGYTWYKQAIDLLEALPKHLHAETLWKASHIVSSRGESVLALSWAEQAAAIAQEQNDQLNLVWALIEIAYCKLGYSDAYEQAVTEGQQALRLFRELDDKRGVAIALNVLGELARANGDYEQAKDFYEQCFQVSQKTGDTSRIVINLINLAITAYHLKDYESAIDYGRRCVKLWIDLGSRHLAAIFSFTLAGPLSALGQPERAITLLSAVEAYAESTGFRLQTIDQMEFEQRVAELREQQDPAIFEKLWARGRVMTTDECIDFALADFEANEGRKPARGVL